MECVVNFEAIFVVTNVSVFQTPSNKFNSLNKSTIDPIPETLNLLHRTHFSGVFINLACFIEILRRTLRREMAYRTSIPN